MARTLGEQVGETIGYRTHLDTRVGPRTRVEVVTEGVLTRMLQHDPGLEEFGIVVFDEFHERSLQADLGLALALQSRAVLRDDLRLLIMSATLDGGPVAALLGGDAPATVVTSEGRAFPVETRHEPRRPDRHLEPQVAALVRRALRETEGDVLVFLPGAAEIGRVERLLEEDGLPAGTYVAPLHGTLDAVAQDRAIAPARAGERKVVLATTIAQTSLTIEGVRVVVDSGLARAPRFSPRTGMTRLETVRISRATADQRRGRAGRVAPGACYRMWDAHDEPGMVPFDRPEILEADLAPLALELAAAGIADPAALRWLDPPPAPALDQARTLLRELEALGPDGRITPHGSAMAGLPAHPRIAHMLVRAREAGPRSLATACDLAALLGQRDVLHAAPGAVPDVDVRLRLDLLRDRAAGTPLPQEVHGARVQRGAVEAAIAEARQWRRAMRLPRDVTSDPMRCGELLMHAYPERVARRRGTGASSGAPASAGGTGAGRYLLRSGSGAELAGAQAVGDGTWLAVAELGGTGAEPRIYTAAPVTLEEVESAFATQLVTESVVAWDGAVGRVRGRRRTRLGALVLRDAPLRDPDPVLVATALLAVVREEGLAVLPWTDADRGLRQRMAFAHAVDHAWPDVSDAALLATLDTWLAPQLAGRTRLEEVDVGAALRGLLDWTQRDALERFAPTHLQVPSGSRIRIDYADAAAPVLAVRLQEVFGLVDTPRIAGGRVPLTVHLLSPAQRPVQVTRDLAGFWRGSYAEVRKAMRGRYPKHDWPEDPLTAGPRRRRGP